jgi:hypothetical protein
MTMTIEDRAKSVPKQPKPKRDHHAVKKETGPCPICQREIKGHPVCRICGILVGPNHLELGFAPAKYARGYENVCEWCVVSWNTKERIAGRKLSIVEAGRGVENPATVKQEVVEIILGKAHNFEEIGGRHM